MANYRSKCFLMFLSAVLLFSACERPWDDRTGSSDQQLDVNVMQQIQSNSNLSTFAGYLVKVGYDKVLAGSKSYTVWAPTNAALQGIDPAVVADTAKLHRFVDNHIASQVYLTTTPAPSLRVRNLLNKNVTITGTTVEDATITVANQYVRNGVVQVIDKMLSPKMNIDEYIRSLTDVGQLQRAYIVGADTSYVDTNLATVASIDPATGKPVLVPGTGLVFFNKYYQNTRDLANEDSLFTYFVLTDAAYTAERNKVAKYFTTVTGSTDTTMNILAAYNVLKDMAVPGAKQLAELPASMLSINSVPVPVDKSAIVQTYNASNGVVYVMSSVNFNVADKITPIVIQGEHPSFFSRTDFSNNIHYRTRKDPNGVLFQDIFIGGNNSLPARSFAAYTLNNLYTCKYQVVWRALNDVAFSSPTDIKPRVIFGPASAITIDATGLKVPKTTVDFPYTAITPSNYDELTLTGATGNTADEGIINVKDGTLNVRKYNSVNLYFQGANSTTANVGAITFDYIKLIPVL